MIDPKTLDSKRQKKWKESWIYKVIEDTSKEKFYILDMFPYPSWAGLHVWHPKWFMASDAIARKKMLQWYNVLHPMWFDTFWLWTELYAIKMKMKPQIVAQANIETYIKQLEMFGCTYDRDRVVNTADPKFFKWTQSIFLKMYNHYFDEKLQKAMPITDPTKQQRLAYVDYKPINRCPSCMTWLANEDLDDGKCERCWSAVEQKPMKQRVLRITSYAQRLIDWLDKVNREESMKDLERNRIWKSEWTQFKMKIITEEKDKAAYMVIEKSIEPTAREELLSFWTYNIEETDSSRWNFYRILIDKKDEEKFIAFLWKNLRTKWETGEPNNWYADSDWTTNMVIFSGWKTFNTSTEEWCLEARNHGISLWIPEYQVRFSPWIYSPGYKDHSKRFEVYTTRVDTVFGMSFVVMAPEHPLVDQITTDEFKEGVEKYKEEAKHKTQLERTELQKDKSWQFTWAYAINPFNWQKVPIYIADYVLANYGTWVVMAVPAHDERDFEFAKKYNISITQSISPLDKNYPDYEAINKSEICYHEKWVLVNSWNFSWLTSDDAIKQMQDRLAKDNIWWKKINYKMQDRVFSRQRYRWEPFPILRVDEKAKLEINFYDQKTREAIVDKIKTIETRAINPEEKDRYFWDVKVWDIVKFNNKETWESVSVKINKVYLRNNLEELWDADKKIIEKIYTNKTTLKNIKSFEDFIKWRDFQAWYLDKISNNGLVWREFEIIKASQKAITLDESDLPLTLPDVENYEPTGTVEWPLAAIDDRVNVTLPDGTQAKRETNTMPGRAGSSRYRLRYMDPNNTNALVWKEQDAYRKNVDVYIWWAEHVTRHMIYARFRQKFLFDLWLVSQDEPFQEYHYVWLIMWEDGRKMSKRRWNVVNPDEIINEFWADTLRTYEMFMWPFDQAIARSTNGIKWVKKFLDKIVALKDKIDNNTNIEWKTLTLVHQTIKKLTEDIDWFRFNTAVSQLMILVNHLTELEKIDRNTFETLVILVSPFAPHTTEELREQIWNKYSIFTKAKRPTYQEKYLVSDEVTLAVQVNWKMRWTILINKDADQNKALELIKADEKISAHIIWEPKKIIYIQWKILNIIL